MVSPTRMTKTSWFRIGIPNIVVFINKADSADEETLELVELEIRDTLK